MRRVVTVPALLALIGLVVSACEMPRPSGTNRGTDDVPVRGTDDVPVPGDQPVIPPTATPTPAVPGVKAPLTSAETLSKAQAVLTQEIALGKIAQTKSQNADVTAFAKKLVADLSDQQTRLEALAKDQNIELLSPAAMGADEKATEDRLKGMTGMAFDKAFLQEIGQANADTITTVRAGISAVTEPTVRQYLTDLQTVLSRQEDAVRQVTTRIGA
jgi:putative membrane protein